MQARRARRSDRRGAALVEAAFVLPIFFLFVIMLLAIGHFLMVDRMLKSACRTAARYGSTEGVTSEQVEARLRQLLSAAFDPQSVDVMVKDASVFDDVGELPEDYEDWQELDDVEVSEASPRQMFLVRATLNYGYVALFDVPPLNAATLAGHATTRHE